MKYEDLYEKGIKEIAENLPEKLLEESRITLSEKLSPPPPVIQIDNLGINPITIFTEGNISVIKGRAKSRKSFAVAMFAAASISNTIIYRKFISVPKKIVVYFDTEQSGFYVQQAMNRVYKMSNGDGFDTRFHVFGLRKYNPEERLNLIEYVFNHFNNLGFVIIDGIRDLIKDINSPDEATMISSKLLKWSDKTNAHILTVLHENPSDGKLRGHVGTELMNKSEAVLKIEKLEDDPSVSRISCDITRGLPFDDIYFRVIDDIPQVISNYEELNPMRKGL